MKKILLLFVLFLALKNSHAQSCSFMHTQVGNTVNFSLPPIVGIYVVDSVNWAFGDGFNSFQTAGGLLPSTPHTYAPGQYNACLTMWMHVIGGTTTSFCNGCDSIFIAASGPCDASFNTVITGLSADFISTSTGPGPITGESWNFGDGSPVSTASNPFHTYSLAGTYVVCHTITGASSAGITFTCTTCDTITVTATTAPCIATYISTTVGNTVNFTSTSSGPGPITSNSWSFGDGSPISTIANPSHTYAASGQYLVCHTVSGVSTATTPAFTCTFCDSVFIAATVPCNASFISTQLGNLVAFTSTSTGPGTISGNIWIFGDGSPNSSLPNPTHTYPGPGTYVACHTISGTSSAGTFSCTTCDTIVITSVGSCLATANFTQGSAGLTANFTNLSLCVGCTTTTYSWNFGDGSPASTVANPAHTYAAGGAFNVCLTITGTDSTGGVCKDTLCKNITVSGGSGVNDIEHTSLSIYPNPVTSSATIALESSDMNEVVVSITDLAGRVLMTRSYSPTSKHEINIDFSGFTKGIYMIRVNPLNGKLMTGKVFKQ